MTQAQAKYLKDYQAPAFTIASIDLVFELADNATRVTATSRVQRCGAHTLPLILDGEDLVLQSLSLNGAPVAYELKQGQLQLETVLDEFELTVVTVLDPKANSSLEGLYMSDGAYCTQCEAEGFRRITYFIDRPDVLAKYTVRIEADRAAFPYLLSNGNLIEQGPLADGRHYACWQDPFPKPSYLFALVAGDFDLLEDHFITRSQRRVKLQVFVDKGNLHKAHHAMASLKKSMAWDESRFDLEYDLDIYMIVAVDFFNMGAMENKGLNVFNTKYVLADTESATDEDYHGIESVVGHEYFHNWTGNRVTCRDWFQLSLKEGLTVFRDQEFSSDLGSRAVNRIHAIKVIKNQQFAEDSGPMSHPIRPESVIEMNNFYTVTVYNKGAEVIRMLHTLLGEAKFQAGMKCYFERHDGQAVTCDDFVAAMEDASGIDLRQFRLWYSQAGTP
ncbi:MAG: aminopeptidase N, partial [Shewanella sp.]